MRSAAARRQANRARRSVLCAPSWANSNVLPSARVYSTVRLPMCSVAGAVGQHEQRIPAQRIARVGDVEQAVLRHVAAGTVVERRLCGRCGTTPSSSTACRPEPDRNVCRCRPAIPEVPLGTVPTGCSVGCDVDPGAGRLAGLVGCSCSGADRQQCCGGCCAQPCRERTNHVDAQHLPMGRSIGSGSVNRAVLRFLPSDCLDCDRGRVRTCGFSRQFVTSAAEANASQHSEVVRAPQSEHLECGAYSGLISRAMMIRAALLLSLCLIAMPSERASAAEALARPAELEPAVNFWRRVYTEITTNEGFVHDDRRLDIVYETVRLSTSSDRARRASIDEAGDRYVRALRSIAERQTRRPHDVRAARHGTVGTEHRQGGTARRQSARALPTRPGRQVPRRADPLRRVGVSTSARRSRMPGLPPEIASLPHVESSFNPWRVRRSAPPGCGSSCRPRVGASCGSTASSTSASIPTSRPARRRC